MGWAEMGSMAQALLTLWSIVYLQAQVSALPPKSPTPESSWEPPARRQPARRAEVSEFPHPLASGLLTVQPRGGSMTLA